MHRFFCLQWAARPRAIVSSVVVHESLAQRSSGLAVNHPQAGLTRALDAAENLRQIQVVMRLGAGRERRTNRDLLPVPFKPGDKGRLAGAREPLQIDPGVIGAHVRIDQRSRGVENYLLLDTREFLVRRLLGLAWCKLR